MRLMYHKEDGMETAEDFWAHYEAALGEKVAAHALGRYLGGWDAYDGPLWGLLIVTEHAFRFHHFAHANWLTVWLSQGDGPKEKVIMIPAEKIVAVQFFDGRLPWWKKIFTNYQPLLTIRYQKDAGDKGAIRIETGRDAQPLVDMLSSIVPACTMAR
jgi:hypothetical protein